MSSSCARRNPSPYVGFESTGWTSLTLERTLHENQTLERTLHENQGSSVAVRTQPNFERLEVQSRVRYAHPPVAILLKSSLPACSCMHEQGGWNAKYNRSVTLP